MENLYKLGEYSGKLPNPKSFSVSGANIIAIKDKPNAFADGFLVDFSVRDSDRKKLEKKVLRTIDISQLGNYMIDAEQSKILLSEPEFVLDSTYPIYVVFTPSGNPILIQVKYYQYLRNRYPRCNFYIKNDISYLITIKVDDKVVGLCTPMLYGQDILNKIKEGR